MITKATLNKIKELEDMAMWLRDEVMDEGNWELNAVANGEVICRKLVKCGLLERKDGHYRYARQYYRPIISIKEAIDLAIGALQDDWIPVSDRLPEADDDVNVTLKDFSETRTGFYSEESWWLITEQGTLENYPINYVVAWKPLPEPYNADMRGDRE